MPGTATRAVEVWKREPEDHDFPAALDYLTLILPAEAADPLVDALRRAETIHRKAKDLLRASQLRLLPATNPHVRSDLKKIRRGQALSPVLLVRGDVVSGRPLQVADGYHRICASYLTDENLEIPCRMVELTR
jgi:hypothetical protein